MLHLALLAVLALPTPAPARPAACSAERPAAPLEQTPEDQADEEAKRRLEQATTQLEQAFTRGDTAARVAAVQAHAELDHPAVIAYLAKGVKDPATEVRSICIDALRYLRDPAALKLLHATYKGDKELRRDESLGVRLIQAIAQHGDPSSIKLLAGDVFDAKTQDIVSARLLGLGLIRHKDSVEALLGVMKRVAENRSSQYMGDFRLSLMVLTGVDRGLSQEAWIEWWNDNKKTLEVPEQAPLMPRADRERWVRYWGLPREYGRETPREKRGDERRGRD